MTKMSALAIDGAIADSAAATIEQILAGWRTMKFLTHPQAPGGHDLADVTWAVIL